MEVVQKIGKFFFRCTTIFECVIKISGRVLYFEGSGRKYLNENSYCQLSGEKTGGNAPESGVEISKFILHVLQSCWGEGGVA